MDKRARGRFWHRTGFRLTVRKKKELRAHGFRVYEIREGYDGSEALENAVLVDFMGTVMTNFDVPFKEGGFLPNWERALRALRAQEVPTERGFKAASRAAARKRGQQTQQTLINPNNKRKEN